MSEHNGRWPSISAVIITRHRPQVIQQTIASLIEMHYPLAEIIVSDDSSDNNTQIMLANQYPDVKYMRGPQRGIAANRNNGIRAATGDFILMMDDDILVQPEFLHLALGGKPAEAKAIYFASIRDGESTYSPKGISYLGFHTRNMQPGERRRTLNSQAFVMPTCAREEVLFDEGITLYGYEEVDFGYQLAARGYKIELVPGCVNIHVDPNGCVTEKRNLNSSRLYVGYKRRAIVEGRKISAFVYLGIASLHLVLSAIRRAGAKALPLAVTDIRLALGCVRALSKQTG